MPRLMTPRRWRLMAIASLALNFALIGVIVGAAFTGRGGDRPDHWRGAPLIAALPEAARAELRQDRHGERSERRARFGALIDAVRAHPFEPAAPAALLREQRGIAAGRADRAEAGLIAALSGMGPAGRAAYADRLQDQMYRRGPRRHD